jgi:cyclophilin family peptidyl-prolyl cis-trans isomerase
MKGFMLLPLALAVVLATSAGASAPDTGVTTEVRKGGLHSVVVMETSHGAIKIELFEKDAPVTVKNFLTYVDDRYYDGTTYHRVISNFMIQGGGFEPGMKEKKTKAPIRNEAANGLSNQRGTVAMARTRDPDSATAQFFINVKDNPFLDRKQSPDKVGYCVFGRVIDGMDVVDKIKAVATGNKGMFSDVPVQDVVIKRVRRIDE